jgi:hypothetical protein
VLVKRADLGAERLRSAVREARALGVAPKVSGGPAAFAGAAEELVPKAGGLELEAHGDRSLIR